MDFKDRSRLQLKLYPGEKKWFCGFTSTLNDEMYKFFFQILKFNEVKSHTFQVEAFCLWKNVVHLTGKQKNAGLLSLKMSIKSKSI